MPGGSALRGSWVCFAILLSVCHVDQFGMILDCKLRDMMVYLKVAKDTAKGFEAVCVERLSLDCQYRKVIMSAGQKGCIFTIGAG